MTEAAFQDKFFGIMRWVVIAGLVVVTIFPFYYMLLLSVKPIDNLLLDPGRIWVSASEFTVDSYRSVLTSVEDGGQGFLLMLRNAALVSIGAVIPVSYTHLDVYKRQDQGS